MSPSEQPQIHNDTSEEDSFTQLVRGKKVVILPSSFAAIAAHQVLSATVSRLQD
jgi:hypothetical protein